MCENSWKTFNNWQCLHVTDDQTLIRYIILGTNLRKLVSQSSLYSPQRNTLLVLQSSSKCLASCPASHSRRTSLCADQWGSPGKSFFSWINHLTCLSHFIAKRCVSVPPVHMHPLVAFRRSMSWCAREGRCSLRG